MTYLDKIARDPLSRRQFLARMSAAGLGAAAVSLLAGCGGGGGSFGGNNGSSGGGGGRANFSGIPGTGDAQVLNYALALETAEADIYRQALNLASGMTAALAATTPLNAGGPNTYLSPTSGGTGTGRAVPPGTGVASTALADVGYLYLAQYAYVEAAHRDFLLTALGHTPDTVGQPTTSNTTNPVVNAKGYKFTPATTDISGILNLILVAEETGVSAYLGAAPSIQSLAYVQIASSIFTTEARHSAGVNYVLGKDTGPHGTGDYVVPGSVQPIPGAANEFEYALDPQNVLTQAKAAFFNS